MAIAHPHRNVRDLKVLVLCGGLSAEREVSFDSGRAVHAALLQAEAEAQLLDLGRDDLSQLEGRSFDILFNALHGAFGEDGRMQCLLDKQGIPYTGSRAPACEVAFDKMQSKKIFERAEVPTPRWCMIHESDVPEEAMARHEIGLPVVVKPVRGGSSQGVKLVHCQDGLRSAVDGALQYDGTVLLETLVQGRELTVGILDGRALPVIELRTRREFYDYEAKYRDDDTEYLCPADLSEMVRTQVCEAALAANEAVGAEHFSRVDIMLDASGRPQVLEVNIIPGFTSHSLLPKAARADGIEFPNLCAKIVELGWNRHIAGSSR
jgi:D-alanine-D-alanine ligase